MKRSKSGVSKGLGHAILIATEAQGAPADFGFIVETNLEKAKASAKQGSADRTLDSQLGKLMLNAVYGHGSVRGLDIDAINRHALREITLEIERSQTAWLKTLKSAKTMPKNPAPRSRALLVGCTKYDNLGAQLTLEGPGNDVVLMRMLLQNKLGVPESEIITLAEEPGDGTKRPTGANVQREMVRLAQTAQRQDQIVIYLNGHGVQMRTDSDKHPLQTTFLPCDAKMWDDSINDLTLRAKAMNALTSNDFALWVKSIVDKKASVWVICDFGHCGGFGLNPVDGKGEGEGIVFTYACLNKEMTSEIPIPDNLDPERKYHGLFTFILAKELAQAKEVLTYAELGDRIKTEYEARGRQSQNPYVAGKDRNKLILTGGP
jgi:hypothetical protein